MIPLLRPAGAGGRPQGFTLVELLVVLAIVALLLTIAAPRYFASLEAAKDAALVQTLRNTRSAIDHFYGDKGRYPESLDELVEKRYLQALPLDPILESAQSWLLLAPDDDSKGRVRDLKSTAPGVNQDGRLFSEL